MTTPLCATSVVRAEFYVVDVRGPTPNDPKQYVGLQATINAAIPIGTLQLGIADTAMHGKLRKGEKVFLDISPTT